MFKKLYMRPYMVTKRRCVWNKTFLLGPIIGIRSFHASFYHFSWCFYICVMTTKASNDVEIIMKVNISLKQLVKQLVKISSWKLRAKTRMHSGRMCTASSLLYGRSPWQRPLWIDTLLDIYSPGTETPQDRDRDPAPFWTESQTRVKT